MAKPVLVTTVTAAETLGVHKRTIHRLVASGQLAPEMRGPGVRGAYLFRKTDVDKLAKARARAAKKAA